MASTDRQPLSTKKAGAITIAGQLFKATVQFIALITFSHLLTPRDIGLIAMLAVFMMLGELIRDFGLSQAAIQSEELTNRQANNLFWINTLVGLAMTSALWAASPLVARLYHEPILQRIAPWVALSFTINGLQAQFQVRLARDLRFVALTITDAAAQLLGFVAGLCAAFAGAEYWSLVIQLLSAYTALLVMRFAVAGWRPGAPARAAKMTHLYQFAIHTGSAQLLNYVAYNIDSYIIAVRWGATDLGFYNRAFQMVAQPTNQLLGPLTNVMLPIMSRRRHEGGDFYPLLFKAQVATSSTLTWAFAISGGLSAPLVRIALGPEWSRTAVLLAILSIGGAIKSLATSPFWAFLASGRSRELLFYGLVTKPMLIGLVATGSLFGVEGVAWGFTSGLTISWFISMAWLKRCDAMPARQFIASGVRVVVSGLLAGGVGRFAADRFGSEFNSTIALIGGIFVVTLIYGALLSLSSETRILVDIAKPRIMARRRSTG